MGAMNLSPGVPLPNADHLYRIIMTKVFKRSSVVDGSSIIDFLLGETKVRDTDIPRINVLDYVTFRKIIKLAKIRHMNESLPVMQKNFYEKNKHLWDKVDWQKFGDMGKANEPSKVNNIRRSYDPDAEEVWANFKARRPLGNDVDWSPEYEEYLRLHNAIAFSLKFMSLMQQCVYQTQYNLKKTKFYRKKFQSNINYRFALMYGMILESKDKIDSLVNMMQSLNHKYIYQREPHQFIYFLSIYEKVLAATTDINYLAHHLMEMTRGVSERIVEAQKTQKTEPRKKRTRPEVRRRS